MSPHARLRRLVSGRRTRYMVTTFAAVIAAISLTRLFGDPSWATLLVIIGLLLLLLSVVTIFILSTSLAHIESRIKRSRKDASRHEWLQEKELQKLAHQIDILRGEVVNLESNNLSTGADQLTWSSSDRTTGRVLFITSNGSGMGHITRCIGISCAGSDLFSSSILTLSIASNLAKTVFPYISSFPSPDSFSARRELWHRAFSDHLLSIQRTDHPDLVVFDGTVIYTAIEDFCRATRTPLVWIRRGLWKQGVDRTQYSAPRLYADHLLVPADVGAEEHLPAESDHYSEVGPIVIRDRSSALDRHQALSCLHLDPIRRYCLVQVGSASVPEVQDLPDHICRLLSETDPEVVPVVVQSPVSKATARVGVAIISGVYPLSIYLNAFDYGVLAAGYNTVHEAIEMGLPALYIPKLDTLTDDQALRAESVGRQGLGFSAKSESEAHDGLVKLANVDVRARIRQELDRVPRFSGATEAASEVADVLRSTETPTC